MVYNETDNSMLRQLQLHELNILKTFAEICDRNHLKYYMIGGTMLGAVRHHGFIPWDDDVDVGMPREDYEQFLRIASREIPDYMKVLNFRTDPDYLRYFSRLIDKRVRVTNDSNSETLVENAWVDIFPLDGLPSNAVIRDLRFLRLCFWRMLYHFSCFDQMVNLMRPGRPLYQRILIRIGKSFRLARKLDSKKILRRIDRSLKQYPYAQAEYVVNFFGAYVQKEIVPASWFGKGRMYPFEDTHLRGPVKYKIYLRNFYGDYRKPPSDTQKDKHIITKIEYDD